MAETVVVPVPPPLLGPPPGEGALRLRVRVPSGHLFAVRGATFSEVVAQEWVIRGTLATTEGAVEAREQGTEAVLLRDGQQTYRYTYATEVLVTIQTAARIRVRWQYAPALGPAVGFRVYRQVGSTAAIPVPELVPVEPGPQTYTYVDTQIQPGVSYSYRVVAVTATGEESVPTPTIAVEVPRSVQVPQGFAVTFVAGS